LKISEIILAYKSPGKNLQKLRIAKFRNLFSLKVENNPDRV